MKLEKEISDKTNLEFRARRIVEKLALALQASIMLRNLPNEISEAFCASRLTNERGFVFGNLSSIFDFKKMFARTNF